MRIYFSFSQDKFLNSYLVANEKTGQAIFIDPLKMEMQTIQLIERHGYKLQYLLFTHGDKKLQREGILTVSKIYRDVKVVQYQFSNYVENEQEIPSEDFFLKISGDGRIELAGFNIEYFLISGLSAGSYCYRIDNVIFCGASLKAGRIGETSSDYASQNLQRALRQKIMCKDKSLLLFPMQGAPTSISVERKYNDDLMFDFNKKRRKF